MFLFFWGEVCNWALDHFSDILCLTSHRSAGNIQLLILIIVYENLL
jgi:hypothetical protein